MSGNWSDEFDRRHYERQEKNKGSGGKSFMPWDKDKVVLNVGETFYARILRPEKNRIYSWSHHWPKGCPKYTCTRDHAAFQNPELTNESGGLGCGQCCYCKFFPPKTRGKRQVKDVLEVIDFRYFHIVPNPEGKKDGAEMMERCVHEEPDDDIRDNRCSNCNDGDERSQKRYFGGHKLMELSEYQYNQVWAAHEKLSHICIAVVGEDDDGNPVLCKNKKGKPSKNYLLCFICRHCEDYLMDEDMTKSTPVLTKQKFKKNRQVCPNEGCGKEDYPFPIFACDGGGRSQTPSEKEENTECTGDEHWIIRGSMFDKVLEITVSGEEKGLKGQGKTITLKNLNVSTGESWSSVYQDLELFGFSEEEIEDMCKPWDLDERYRPSFKTIPKDFTSTQAWVEAVLKEQAENVGEPNPFSGGPDGPRRGFKSGSTKRSFRS